MTSIRQTALQDDLDRWRNSPDVQRAGEDFDEFMHGGNLDYDLENGPPTAAFLRVVSGLALEGGDFLAVREYCNRKWPLLRHEAMHEAETWSIYAQEVRHLWRFRHEQGVRG